MKHKNGYFRYQRIRTIRRKYRILVSIYGRESARYWYKGRKNALSKNKIHCSCCMCRAKSYDDWKFRDYKIIKAMEASVKEFYYNIKEGVSY